MALARVQYESDGSTTEYSIPFPYISRDDVYVSLDGTETDAWMFLDGSTVKLDSAQPLGTIIDVARKTERNNLLVEFNDGSTLLETDLTLAAQQSFFIAQEAFDQTGATLTVAEDGSYSANGRRVSQLEWPNSDDDAANQGYVLDVFADGYNAHDERVLAQQARNAAQAAESAAATSESNAATSETNAASSASSAATSASNAATSETNAASSAQEASTYLSSVEADALAASNSADAAATSETNAAGSASAAASSETDAQAAAANAQNSENAAASSETNAATSESNAQTYRTQAQGYASDADTSASNAASSETAAASSETNAAASETEAQNWANTAEDTLVPEGDQVDDYSALHWARKAEGWASSVNMPSAAGNGGKLIRQASDESGFEYMSPEETREAAELEYSNLPWLSQPIGSPFPLWDHLSGVTVPPTDDSRFSYIKLTAGEVGSGGYNEGLLINESVSGTDPLVEATAEIAVGPLAGQVVHLINTEQSLLRAREISGDLQFDQMQKITGRLEQVWQRGTLAEGALQTDATAGTRDRDSSPGSNSSREDIHIDTSQSPNARTSSTTNGETRPKNVSATYYMRIG